jgi:dipeptidyl aminopeptidase/acylaminoacyl peptidase
MGRLPLVALSILACALSAAQDSPLEWTPELALKVKRVSDVQVSPDGKLVAYVVGEALTEGEKSEWLYQIHVSPSDGSPGFPLTRGEKSSEAPRWSPDGTRVGFVSARGGKANVWTIRVDGGEAEPLTDEKGGVSSFTWSPDGSQIAFLMSDPPTDQEEKNEKEKRDAVVVDEDLKRVGLYVIGLARDSEGKRISRRLSSADVSVGGGLGAAEVSFSRDGKSIAFAHTPTPKVDDWTKADISVVDVESGRSRVLVATGASETEPRVSPDGKWIAYRRSDDPPTWAFTSRVHLIPLEGGASRVLADTFDSQAALIGWSSDGAKVFVSETKGTVDRLSALPVDGGAEIEVSPADVMVFQPNLNAAGTHVGFTSEDFARPVEAYASSLSGLSSFAPNQVSRVQDLPAAPLGATQVIRWSSSDGRSIEGLLTLPVGYREGERVPLLVIVHGGPTGVFVRSFIAQRGAYPIASFAARGYAVLRANVRGSSGYGRDFRYANYGDWGGGDYQDILTGVDHVIALGVADPERLGVMGWSYGGFMTSWIITQTNRFKAASVGAGVTNLMSFTGTADIPGFIPDYFGGEFWDVFETWRSHSAMFHVQGVTTPTLIQHGEKDRRVPVSQGYELYNALVRQDVDTMMVVYPRQGHGIQEPKLLLDAMERNLAWFEKHVPAGRLGTSSSQP